MFVHLTAQKEQLQASVYTLEGCCLVAKTLRICSIGPYSSYKAEASIQSVVRAAIQSTNLKDQIPAQVHLVNYPILRMRN